MPEVSTGRSERHSKGGSEVTINISQFASHRMLSSAQAMLVMVPVETCLVTPSPGCYSLVKSVYNDRNDEF